MQPFFEDGWLVVPCNADDTARVEIKVGAGEPRPAFRDYYIDQQGRVFRVAKVRSAHVRSMVTLTVNGASTTFRVA